MQRVGEESLQQTRLIAAIQALGAWGRVQSGVWIVETDVPVPIAFDALMEHLDAEHPLLVAQVSGEVKPQWANSLCDSAWLRTRV